VPKALRDQERDLLARIRGFDLRIDKENAKDLDNRNANLVEELYQERRKKEEALSALVAGMRKDYPQYAALQYPKPCTLKQARDCMEKNEVAVLFAVDEKES